MVSDDVEDDEEVILLSGKAESLLRELQTIETELGATRPQRRLTTVELRVWRAERARLVERKQRIVTEYRAAKGALKGRRREVMEAIRDVERDLTDPDDLIHALLAAACEYGAYRTHQDLIDAAQRYLGRRA